MVLKMRSGLGLEVVVVASMSLGSYFLHVITPVKTLESAACFGARAVLLCHCSEPAHAGILSLPAASKRHPMKREYQRWYSQRLGLELGVAVYGHWGPPLLGFPTSAGDEWEVEGHGLVDALGDFIEGGNVKLFTVNCINELSFYNKGAHPFRRSYVQA